MPMKAVPLDGDGVIDLDSRRAARLEKTGPKMVRLGGRSWEFRAELPMRIAEYAAGGDMVRVFKGLLVNPDDSQDFLEQTDLTQDDFAELVQAVYGLDLGKSLPSTAS